MILPPFLQRWILLNLIRLLTIVSCALVISATIRTLKINFEHYPPPLSSSVSSDSLSYYPSTDIPTTFLGVFWSTLHHVSITLVLFTVILSELSLPVPLLNRLFKNTLPFLGPNWGTGFLGVLLVLVAGDGLSRGAVGGRFHQVSCWILAGIGVANAVVGVVWRAKVKLVRSPMAWKKDVAEKMDRLADAKANAERVVDTLPLPATLKSSKTDDNEGGGLKGLVSLAGKIVASKLEKNHEKGEVQKVVVEEKQEEKVEETISVPELSIFKPPLPSAIIRSRPVDPPITIKACPPPLSTLQTPPQTTTQRLPPSIHSPRTPSIISCSSTYTLDLPPTTPPQHLLKPPTIKTVRFNSVKPTHLSTTIDSHHVHPEEVGVEGSKFLLLPSPTKVGLLEGERSPSVLASLKAAMLEAEAKAKAKPCKKSLYLGSNQWRAEYAGLSESEAEDQPPYHESDVKSSKEKAQDRPYRFL